MKKNIFALLLVAVVAVPVWGVYAQNKNENADRENEIKNRPLAKDVKIHKKKVLSGSEKAVLDRIAKEKPLTAPGLDKKDKDDDASADGTASGVLGQSLPAGGERYAIVVGLANYSGVANDLCTDEARTELDNPTVSDGLAYYCQDRDSFHMKQALMEKYGYEESNIIHLHDSGATREGIINVLNALSNNPALDENDEVVFFFSGHGTSGRLISLKDKEQIDEAIFTYDNDFIWDDEFKIWADGLGVNRAVFAFDICLAGGMSDLAGDNRVLALSSGEKESSWTYYLGGMLADGEIQMSEGLFSHNFAKDGMIEGLADGSNLLFKADGNVAVEEAFSYTLPIVRLKQTPVLSDKFIDDLLLGF